MESNFKIIFCSLLTLAFGFGLVNGFEFIEEQFTPCTEGKFGRLIALRTNSCDTFPQECDVYTGNTYNFEMEFETGFASTNLTSYVTGVIAGFELPWPEGPQGPSCNLITYGSCPYEQGQKLIFRASIFVNTLYPQASVIGRWRLRDEFDQNHICLNIPLRIRNGGGTTTTVDPPQDDPTTTVDGQTTSTTIPTTTVEGQTTPATIPTTDDGQTTPRTTDDGQTTPRTTDDGQTTSTTTKPDVTTNGATNIFSISILIISLGTLSLLAK